MKKISLLTLSIAILIASCGKVDFDLISDIFNADKTVVAIEDLPNEALEVLNTDYFETYIDEVLYAEGLVYEVNLSNSFQVFFDTEGDCLNSGEKRKGKKGKHGNKGGEAIEIADLPTTIIDYITTNYTDATAERAKLNRNGEYMVKITGDLILVFDTDGNFIEEFEFMDHQGHKGTKIEVADLPVVITDYITANYTTATIKVAFQKEDNYAVGLSTDEGRVLLIFDADGNFIEAKTCNGG